MNQKLTGILLFSALAVTSQAAIIEVLPGTTWTEQSTAGCPCTSSINGNQPRSGLGSLELIGPRSRFTFGDGVGFTTNLGLLSSLTALSYEFRTDVLGSAPAQTYPVMRIVVADPTNSFVSELIWENANNFEVPFVTGTWQSADVFASNNLWRFVFPGATQGRTFNDPLPAGAESNFSITNWANATDTSLFNSSGGSQSPFSAQAYIVAFSVGVGGGATGYLGYADNVTIGFNGVNNTYNFEAVPEPSTFALMGGAIAALAFARRKRS
jgi:hypothetical protein